MQEFTVPPRALFRCAHAGENVLLDEAIAFVVLRAQPAQQRRKVDATFTEFAEDAVAEAIEVIPPLGSRARCKGWLEVFQMDIPDAVFEAIERSDQVAFLFAGAKAEVAGIEDQAEPLRIGEFKQGRNLFRSFDVTGAVVMKDG